jgi:DNA-3-methyladenine glycosylase II
MTLSNAIVGQQISTAAAEGIWRRLHGRFPDFSAPRIAEASAEDLRACGLSARKIEYLRGIAEAIVRGELDFGALESAEDAMVRQRLCALRGVGPWTSEMFLIFHLRRPDVLPLGDMGLVRGCQRLYGWPEAIPAAELRERVLERGALWKPWRTVATWYIWRSLDGNPIVY